ncbi:NUDIX domain-containing protein [Paenibacillus rhizovicinus]|uniref:NUDIX domain-containing protein n=1 Tax=Paenibacillus rhizovicinus TaxID=2704463 RepID=A0A6C0P003_9BACL|nr:NUDIX domain-containing protein [Paenibacillus rhizovicinus]QHW31787.1 NUDIX domain-containing protein [Paenibacillus rhizovicinus]
MTRPPFRLRACALIIKDGNILLVAFRNDEDEGVHYNLPAGGVEPGETLAEAAIREAMEEACVDIEVGPVAFVYEYQPAKNDNRYGDTHSVGITFACSLKGSSEPRLPDRPDLNQIDVRWVPIAELDQVQLYPEITRDIMDYYAGKPYRNYVEEHEIQTEKAARERE